MNLRYRGEVILARTRLSRIDKLESAALGIALHPVQRDVRELAFTLGIPAADIHVDAGEPGLDNVLSRRILHHAEERTALVRRHRMIDPLHIWRAFAVMIALKEIVRGRNRIPEAEHLYLWRRENAAAFQTLDGLCVFIGVGLSDRNRVCKFARDADFGEQPAERVRNICTAAEPKDIYGYFLSFGGVEHFLGEPAIGEAERAREVRGEHAAEKLVARDGADALDVCRLGVGFGRAVEVLLELPDVRPSGGLVPGSVDADDELHWASSSQKVSSTGLAMPSEPQVARTSHHF